MLQELRELELIHILEVWDWMIHLIQEILLRVWLDRKKLEEQLVSFYK